VLVRLGFKAIDSDLSLKDRLKFGLFISIFVYFGTLLIMISITQAMKFTLKRTRPNEHIYPIRFRNYFNFETGTPSMPSGDSAAASIFCFYWTVLFNLPLSYLILPFVMFARVYYYFHYIGDTLVGIAIGTACGTIVMKYFFLLVPLAKAITGSEAFS